jgi:hypothetical protein
VSAWVNPCGDHWERYLLSEGVSVVLRVTAQCSWEVRVYPPEYGGGFWLLHRSTKSCLSLDDAKREADAWVQRFSSDFANWAGDQ